jgi:hypothetical protein
VRRLLACLLAVSLAVLAAGWWWRASRTPTGELRAHLTLGRACSQSFSPQKLCNRLSNQPLRVVVEAWKDHGETNWVLTANGSGDLTARLPAGDYSMAFVVGDAASITNAPRRFTIPANGSVDVGTIHPNPYAIEVGAELPM